MRNPLIASILIVTANASAAVFTWQGTSTSWTTASNWNPSGIPGNTTGNYDIAYFQAGSFNTTPRINKDIYVNAIGFSALSSAYELQTTSSSFRFIFGSASPGITIANDVTQPITIEPNLLLNSSILFENSSSSPFTISGAISEESGQYSVQVNGTGTTIFSAASSYTGTTTVGSNATLALQGAGSLSSSSAIVINGTLNLSGMTASSQTSPSLSGSGEINLGAKQLQLTNSSPNTFSGSIIGTGGALNLTGTSTLTLSGANSYTGTTTIGASYALLAGAVNSFAPNSLHSIAGTLDLSGFNNAIGSISGNGFVESDGGAATLTINNGGTFGGVLRNGTGTLALTISGGTLTLTNTNTYTGLTTISSGTLALSGSGSIPSTSSVVANGTFSIIGLSGASQTIASLSGSGGIALGAKQLQLTNSSPNTFSGGIYGTGGALNLTGTSTLTLSGANSYTGTTTVGASYTLIGGALNSFAPNSLHSIAGTLDLSGFNNSIGSISGNGFVQSNGGAATLTITNGGTFAGVLQNGSGTLGIGLNTGTLTLTSANTYTGATTISGGTLLLTGDGALSASTSVTANGTLNISGKTASFQTIAGLSGTGAVVLGNKEIEIDNSSPTTFSGTISGVGGSLNLTGASTLTLSGTNTYTGATTVSATSTLASGATNSFPPNSAFAVAGTLNLGSFNNALLTISGNGTIQASSGTPTLTITNGGTFGGVIQNGGGTLALTLGSGTLTLTNGNTYTGATTISGGTLALTGSGALAATTSVTANGTFDISGKSSSPQTIANLSGNGTVNLGNNELAFGTSTSTTFTGTIGGAGGSLSYLGTATFTQGVSGSNYTGTTTVGAGGTFRAGVANAFAPGSNFVVNGTLSLNNFSNTINALSGSGSITLGSGNLTIADGGNYTGSLSGTGDVLLTGGELLIGGGTNSITGSTIVSNSATLTLQANNGLSSNSALILQDNGTINLGIYNSLTKNLTGSEDSKITGSGRLTIMDGGVFDGVVESSAGIYLSGGTLEVSNTNTTSGTIIINFGAQLNLVEDGSFPNTNDFTNSNILDISGITTSTTISNINPNGSTLTNSRILLGSKELIVDTTDVDIYYIFGISGTGGSLTKTGSSLLLLAGPSTYTGPTTISEGTLGAINGDNSFPPNSDFTVNGTLDLRIYSEIIKSLSGTGLVTSNTMIPFNQTLTISSGGSFSGTIDSTLAITLSGGTLSLNPASSNTYTGATSVSNGATLSALKENALSADSALNLSGTLLLNNFPNLVLSLSGGATGLVSTGMSADAGILSVSNGGTYAGAISGGGGLTVTGGSLTLSTTSEANTYTGATTISNSASLVAGAVDAFSPFSDYTLEDMGTLNLNGFDNTIASLSSSDGTTTLNLGSNSNLTINGGATTTFAGSITNAPCGGLTITGGTELTLTGASTYCGPTFISDGILTFSGAGTSSPDSEITIGEAGVLVLDNSSLIYEAKGLSNSGLFTNSGILNLETSYSQGSTAITSILFDGVDTSKINSDTNLILNGELIVSAAGMFPTTGSFAVLSSDIRRSGQFTTFTPQSFGMSDPALIYSSQNVYLVFPGCTNTWSLAADGNWNDADNWSGGCVPGVSGNDNDFALFGDLGELDLTVTLLDSNDDPQSLTLVQLAFNGDNTNYTINQFSSDTTITFDSSGEADPNILSLSGNNTINAPIILNTSTQLFLYPDSTLTFGSDTTMISDGASGGFQVFDNTEGGSGVLINEGNLTPSSFLLVAAQVENKNLIEPEATFIVSPLLGETATLINDTTGARLSTTGTAGLISVGLDGVTVVENTGIGAQFGTLGANSTFIVFGPEVVGENASTTVLNSGTGTKMGSFGTNGRVAILEGTVNNESGALFVAGPGGFLSVSGGTLNNDLTSTVGASNHNLILEDQGTLNTSGNVFAFNFEQLDSSVLKLNLTSSPNVVGNIAASGTASVASTLKIESTASNLAAGQVIDLIRAERGVSGKYDSVQYINFPKGLIPNLFYGDNIIQLTMSPTLTSTPTGSVAQLPLTSINEIDLILGREAHQLHRAIAKKKRTSTQLSASIASENELIAYNEALESSEEVSFFRAKSNRIEKENKSGTPAVDRASYNSQFYFGPLDNFGDFKNQGTTQAGFGYNSIGFLTGYDYLFDTYGLGVAVDFGRTSAHVNHGAGDLRMYQLHAAGYGTWSPDSLPNLGVDFILGYGYEWYKSHRKAGAGLTTATAKGSTQGMVVNVLLGTEYLFDHEQFKRIPSNLLVTPYFNFQYIWTKADHYNEQGAGVYNLSVAGQHANSFRSTLGSSLEWNLSWRHCDFIPALNLGWQFEFLDSDRTISFSTIQLAQNQLLSSGIVGAGRNTLLFGIALPFTLYEVFEIEASYDLQWNSIYLNNSIYLKLGGNF